jgi:alkylation response protein AidB-like acyl-CoA dehydrogenase
MSAHELTDEQQEVRALARRFADEVVAPRAGEWDREHRFPREVFEQLGELGLMGVCVPDRYAGAGADYLSYALVLEELSRADAGVGVTLAVHTGAGTMPILAHGSDEQKDRYVPPLAQGHELAAFALTESGSGSDAGAMLTRAETVPAPHPHHRITGTKQWITNGSYAHTFLVFAKEDGKPTGFLVRRGAEGFSVTREEEKMGLNSSSTADLAFEDTPGERIGPAGGRDADRALDARRRQDRHRRQAVGIAQAALELATGYAKERVAFGGPIGRFQAIQHKLADMQTEVEAARALVWRAARLKQAAARTRSRARRPSSSRRGVARHWTGEAIQVLGGYGLHEGVPRRALLPRREGHRDLRGDVGDPAARDRPGPPRRARRLGQLRLGHVLEQPAAALALRAEREHGAFVPGAAEVGGGEAAADADVAGPQPLERLNDSLEKTSRSPAAHEPASSSSSSRSERVRVAQAADQSRPATALMYRSARSATARSSPPRSSTERRRSPGSLPPQPERIARAAISAKRRMASSYPPGVRTCVRVDQGLAVRALQARAGPGEAAARLCRGGRAAEAQPRRRAARARPHGRAGPRPFDRAAVRWVARLGLERRLGIADLRAALAACELLCSDPEHGRAVLARLMGDSA